jgi:drug/metabolite transporter (DMT)-like permease
MAPQDNPERTGVGVGVALTALGLFLILWPGLSHMDMMGGGFALRFIGLFVGLAGLLTWWIYQKRATTFNRMLSGESLLAHWTYDPEGAQSDAREEYEERRSDNRSQFRLVAGMMLVAGFFFLILPILRGEDLFLPIIIIYFGAIALIGFVAWAAPRSAYRRALRAGGDTFISTDGLYVRGQLHTWSEPFSDLKLVRVVQHGEQTFLEIQHRHLTRLGFVYYQTVTTTVPVPPGKEAEAERVVEALQKRQ